MINAEVLQISTELMDLLLSKDAVPQVIGQDPALLDGVHALCCKHGSRNVQQALDWLETTKLDWLQTSKNPSHRLVLDAVTAVIEFNREK